MIHGNLGLLKSAPGFDSQFRTKFNVAVVRKNAATELEILSHNIGGLVFTKIKKVEKFAIINNLDLNVAKSDKTISSIFRSLKKGELNEK